MTENEGISLFRELSTTTFIRVHFDAVGASKGSDPLRSRSTVVVQISPTSTIRSIRDAVLFKYRSVRPDGPDDCESRAFFLVDPSEPNRRVEWFLALDSVLPLNISDLHFGLPIRPLQVTDLDASNKKTVRPADCV